MKLWKKPAILSLCEKDLTEAIRASARSEMCVAKDFR